MSGELLSEIRSGAQYKKYQKILEAAQTGLDLDVLRAEALGSHSARTSRQLYGSKQYSPKALVDAVYKDLAFRSRMVEIRVKVSVALSNLDEASKAMRRYISTEYSDDLLDFSTADQRRSFVDRVLKVGLAYLAEGQALLDMMDSLIKDCDQAGFSLRNAVETLKLLDGSKSGKVI